MVVLKRTHSKSRIVRLNLGYQTDSKLLSMRATSDQTILQLIVNDGDYIAEVVETSLLKKERDKDSEDLKKIKERLKTRIKFYEERLEKIETEKRKRIDNYGMKKETSGLNEELEHFRQQANTSYNVLDELKKLLKGVFNGD